MKYVENPRGGTVTKKETLTSSAGSTSPFGISTKAVRCEAFVACHGCGSPSSSTISPNAAKGRRSSTTSVLFHSNELKKIKGVCRAILSCCRRSGRRAGVRESEFPVASMAIGSGKAAIRGGAVLVSFSSNNKGRSRSITEEDSRRDEYSH